MRAALEGADPTLRPRGGGHITPEELQVRTGVRVLIYLYLYVCVYLYV